MPEYCVIQRDWKQSYCFIKEKIETPRKSVLQKIFYPFITRDLSRIDPESLVYTKPLGLVHKDFFNNNILFDEGHFRSFIDIGLTQRGLCVEDYLNLVFYNLRRVRKASVRRAEAKRLLGYFFELTNDPASDWLFALNTRRVAWALKVIQRISLNRAYRYIMFLKDADFIEDYINSYFTTSHP